MAKATKPMKRPRLGDVVHVSTPDGAAYAQYTHRHPEFGDLVRVTGPADGQDIPEAIAARPTQFVTFFPLGAACRRGIARIVGPAPIPAPDQPFPVFRQALRLDPSSKTPCNWLIWDGDAGWTVKSLDAQQHRYPIRAIMNDTLLVQRALSGWTVDEEV